MPALLALCLLQTAWTTHSFPPGFSIDLPEPPIEMEPPGAPPGSRLWVSIQPGNRSIVVGWFPLNKGEKAPPDAILANTLAGSAKGAKSRVVGEKDVLLNGWPGVEFRMKSPAVFAAGQSYVVDDAILQVALNNLTEKGVDAPAAKLFASLKLAPTKPKGPLTKPGPEMKRHPIGESGLSVELPKPPKVEDVPLEGDPNRILHRFTAPYMTRLFAAAYLDMPKEVNLDDPNQADQILGAVNADVVKSMKGKNVKDEPTTLAGHPGLRTTLTFGDGGYQRIETILYEGRIITLFARVPAYLAKSPQIEGFFASAKTEK